MEWSVQSGLGYRLPIRYSCPDEKGRGVCKRLSLKTKTNPLHCRDHSTGSGATSSSPSGSTSKVSWTKGIEQHPAVLKGRKKRTPRFLPTLGRPCAVAFPFIRWGQLVGGLSPPRSRPCRAHPYNSGLNPGVLRLFLIKNGRKWTELDSHSADPPDRQLFIRIADYPIFRYNDFHGHYRTNRRSRTANITSLRQKKIGT
jgi:hypothetical protein